jgi:hypothetical protein
MCKQKLNTKEIFQLLVSRLKVEAKQVAEKSIANFTVVDNLAASFVGERLVDNKYVSIEFLSSITGKTFHVIARQRFSSDSKEGSYSICCSKDNDIDVIYEGSAAEVAYVYVGLLTSIKVF